MIKDSVLIAIVCGIVLLLPGCGNDKVAMKKDFDRCLSHSGVPIRSFWEYDLMADCVWPPQ